LTIFSDFQLNPAILKSLDEQGYRTPTPIQVQAIPSVLCGRDLLGIAQTGTGKTAAFALPILHRLAATRREPLRKGCRVLVLSPTRELANQICESFRVYGRHLGIKVAAVYGGVAHRPQSDALARGLDVLVATPGRLLDHMGERNVSLGGVEILVLDEADQMLDMGFVQPIRRIVATIPARRQSLFFSATMPKEIGRLASEMLTDPLRVAVTPSATPVERVRQQVYLVEAKCKRALLVELFANPELSRTIVFTRTKRSADKVARHLEAAGINVAAIHGNKSQGQRQAALAAFKASRVRALVATDVAARGIDIDHVSHVVNFELPNIAESYVHRIGRTARAGAAGVAISLCDGEERAFLADIERLTRQSIPTTDRRRDATLVSAEPTHDGENHRGQRHRGRSEATNGRPQRQRNGSRGGMSDRRGPREEGRHAERRGPRAYATPPALRDVNAARPGPVGARYDGTSLAGIAFLAVADRSGSADQKPRHASGAAGKSAVPAQRTRAGEGAQARHPRRNGERVHRPQ
jgi:ATP-dependent RNA helicase RhlE